MYCYFSTFSSGLHSVASCIWEDFLRFIPSLYHAEDEESAMEKQVQVTRALTTSMALVVVGIAHLASVYDVVLEIGGEAIGILSGPILAVFLLGFFTYTANKLVMRN